MLFALSLFVVAATVHRYVLAARAHRRAEAIASRMASSSAEMAEERAAAKAELIAEVDAFRARLSQIVTAGGDVPAPASEAADRPAHDAPPTPQPPR